MTNTFKKTLSHYLMYLLAAHSGLVGLAGMAHATISNAPPLVKPLVSPNIFYTLDDSGSMMFEQVPDDVPKTGDPNQDRYWDGSSWQHKGAHFDDYCAGTDHSCWVTNVFPKPYNLYNVSGAGEYGSDYQVIVGFNHNITVARWRSSDVNHAYYDPKVRYQPWASASGTGMMANANPRAALFNPVAPAGGSNANTINLTTNQTYDGSYYYFLRDDASDYDTNGRTFYPALYYVYKGGAGCNQSRLSCFTRYEIRTSTVFPAKAPARTDCAGATCTYTEEMQNFANWFQYARSRILMARGGSGQAFAKQGSGIRVGFGTINTAGTVISHVTDDFSPSNKSTFLTTLYTQRMPAAGTPLRRAVDDVGQYFSDTSNTGPWQTRYGVGDTSTQLSCRQNYNILMTDGYWNDGEANGGRTDNYDGATAPTINGPGTTTYTYNPVAPYTDTYSDTLADIAFYYWSRELRPDWPAVKKNVPVSTADPAFWQHMTMFTVGLGVHGILDPATDLPALTAGTKVWPDASQFQVDDLWHAAVNTRGSFFSVSNPTEFAAAFDSALNTISQRVGDSAAVGTSSNTVRNGSALYTSSYRTTDWSGQVVQRPLDADGNITTGGWTASLPSFAARKDKVFTYVDGTTKGAKFDIATLAPGDKTYFTTEAATYSPPGAVTAANIVDYIKGGPDLGFLRPRTQPFGDFVNSAPQYLKEGGDGGYSFLPASAPEHASAYTSFLTSKASRASMVYIGGNDGMLHALDGSTGVEKFAYVPKAVMSNLPLLSRKTYGHRFYVDGTPVTGDYWDSGWKTALVGTTGAGGRSVFALDVSAPASFGASNVLWEVTSADDSDLGYTIGAAEIGRMPNGDWVAVVGNGYQSTNNHAVLFIIRLKDGHITKIDTGSGSAVTPNGLSSPRLFLNIDSTIKAIYAGDLLGNMWKFNVTPGGTSVAFTGAPLFQAVRATKTQPITVQPDLVPHPRGGIMVLFGTGKVFESEDPLNTDIQSIYGVWDNYNVDSVTNTAITGSQSALQKQTLSVSGNYYNVDNQPVDYTAKRGWYMDLDIASSVGERITINPQVFFDEVVFTSVIPASALDTCSSDGRSTTFILRSLTGGTFPYPTFDTNGDGKVDSSDTLIAGLQGGLTFGTTIIKKGNRAIIYQPPSAGGTDPGGAPPNKANIVPSANPTKRIWKQLLRTD